MAPEDRVACLEQGLAKARRVNSVHYDDVFREVQQRIAAVGSIGKSDIAMLSFWKRLRADTPWVRKLLGLADVEVRGVTALAVIASRTGDSIEAAGQARELLRPLPGLGHGTALASALLTVASPSRLAVYDKRARKGLSEVELELADGPPLFYARYMRLIEQCRTEAAEQGHGWSPHDVDLALYTLGRPAHRLALQSIRLAPSPYAESGKRVRWRSRRAHMGRAGATTCG
jgi:hypothetical protein